MALSSEIKEYTLTKIRLDQVRTDPSNPNKMTMQQMLALEKSMHQFGYLTPIIVDAETMMIADGEHRYQVYKELGYEEIPAYVIRFDNDGQRRTLRQVMNKLHGTHEKQLDSDEFLRIMEASQQSLQEMADMIAQPREHMEALLLRFHPDVQLFNPDTEMTNQQIANIVPITQLGDMWQLGPHLLVCGDCTDATIMQRLFNDNATISQLNTDAPYGVDYSSKNDFFKASNKAQNHIKVGISNDEITSNLNDMFNLIFQHIPFADYNTIYIWSAGFKLHEIRMAMQQSQITWGDYLVWVKNNHVLGRKDYNAQHEFCIYGWKGKHEFYGPHRTTILEYDKPLVNDLHPTMKPVEMIRQTITDGTKEGDIVLDCFAGSGSSLIACEQTARKWRGIELDPHYCDVIVARWEKYTGQQAVRLRAAENEQ